MDVLAGLRLLHSAPVGGLFFVADLVELVHGEGAGHAWLCAAWGVRVGPDEDATTALAVVLMRAVGAADLVATVAARAEEIPAGPVVVPLRASRRSSLRTTRRRCARRDATVLVFPGGA